MTYRETFKLIALHAFVFAAAFAVFIILFSTPFFVSVLLFYRGLLFIVIVALAMVFALVLLKRRFGHILTYRDIIIAALSFSFASTVVFICLPVTLDRSISVFMLGYMAKNPSKSFTTAEMDQIFIDDYVHQNQSIQRRFDEQVISKNVVPSGDGYVISSRGERLTEFFELVANLFAVNKRFVDPLQLEAK